MKPTFLLLVGLTAAAYGIDSGAAPLPPRGWSSWNSFGLNINEEVVRASARTMATELLPSGYEYLLIDDGWPPDTAHVGRGPARDPNTGRIPVSETKFPSGFRNLTDYVHSLGLKIGIYTAVSTWTCGGFTGSLGHEDIDARAFVEWGFDFVKHDTCAGYNGEPADECGVQGSNCIRNSTTHMSQALQKYAAAAGKKVVYYIDHGNPTSPQRLFNPKQYYMGNGVNDQSDVSKLAIRPDQLGWTWAAGVCNMMKTCFDTHDSWDSMLNNLHSTINLQEYQQPGYYTMPDMLSVGQGGQTQSQYRAQMLLWSVLGAPLILGADIRKMDNFTKMLVTAPEVLAVNADPDCVRGSLLRSRGSYEVWGKPLRNRVDGKNSSSGHNGTAPAFAVVMFNKGEQVADAELIVGGAFSGGGDFYPVHIGGKYEVRDLLLQKDLGVKSGTLSTTIPPMDAVMLQIVPI